MSRREKVLDHAVVGTPNGPEYREFVEVYDGQALGGWAIKHYGGRVPWSLVERRTFRDRRSAIEGWLEAMGHGEVA